MAAFEHPSSALQPRARRGLGRIPAATWIAFLLLLAVGYLILPPVAGLVLGSLTDSDPGETLHFTFDTLAYAYGGHEHYGSLLNSLIYAATTATSVLVLGGFLAWLAARTDSSLRRMADLFALAPILIPAVLFTAGWILLLGPKNGLINLLAMQYLGLKSPPFDIFSFWGMIWVGTLQELPLAFLWLYPAFQSMNPTLEEAALMAGAKALTIMRRILLPLLRPAILSAWIIFFVFSLGGLIVPLMIGLPARIILYSTEIYLADHRVPSDLNLASAYSLLLLVTTIVGVQAYRFSTREGGRFVTVTGKAFTPRITRLGRWRLPVTLFGVLILLLTAGLPIFILVWNAFMPFPQAPSVDALKLVTLANFRAALHYDAAIRALINSLLLGLAAGVVASLLGALIAWSTLRLKRPRWILVSLDQLATLPIAVPGMIIGVSLLWFYLSMPVPVYGTRWILLIAYVTLHLPYAVRICASGLAQLHQELEEAGYVAGGNRWQVLRRIVVSLIGPSLFASVLYVALRSFREYSASIFLASPGNEVFSVLVLDMWDGGNLSILSAYVTMVIALLAVLVGVFTWIARRIGAEMTARSS